MQKGTNYGTLFVVATPIGNLKDITLRAIEILKKVDIIVCEDTRVTGRLASHLGIKKPLYSLHQHSSDNRVEFLIRKLEDGCSMALVTDSGTPGISDPGAPFVREAINAKIRVIPIPGPSALTAALSVSGLNSKNIIFLGFLPKKKGRQKKFKEIYKLIKNEYIVVIYESPYRIKKIIREINNIPDKLEVRLFREITKKFEEIRLLITPIGQEGLEKMKTKGEYVVILSRKR